FKLKGRVDLSEMQLLSLLNLIPNVEELHLERIRIAPSTDDSKEELKLWKLRKLQLLRCYESLFFLVLIPKDVLTEFVFEFSSLPDRTELQHFLDRQSNIKKLEICFHNDMNINLNHLKLEHLNVQCNIFHNLASVIRSQPELRYLDCRSEYFNDPDVFRAACELKRIETLKISIALPCEFNSLRKLTTLKELQLGFYGLEDNNFIEQLSMMKSLSQMAKLTLMSYKEKLTEEIVIRMSESFRSLSCIQLVCSTIKDVGTILEHMPHLTSITWGGDNCNDNLEISEDYLNEKLTELSIKTFHTNRGNTEALLKVVNACPNLERIILSKLNDVTLEEIMKIVDNHINIRYLDLEFEDCRRFTFDARKTSRAMLDYSTLDQLLSSSCE
ncbi:MAG TPA: hypothetical protein VIJ14_10885, partial [Rhabdochlamydiaceae bacterium]